MKLRTRIIWISCVTFLFASLVSEAFICFFMWRNLREQAVFKGYQKCYELVNKIEQVMERIPNVRTEKINLNYILKQYEDNYNICYMLNATEGNVFDNGYYDEYFSENNVYEIYNNTVITFGELVRLKYNQYNEMTGKKSDLYVSDEEIYFSYMNLEGRDYVVFGEELGSNIVIYRIEDITYVKENMMEQATVMLVITFIVVIFTIILLLFILKKALNPLQDLNRTAMSMAEGQYDQRIVVGRKDEIGQLGENFNKMAEAVEIRTKNLEESEQRKTIFMGNLTHELKTPMTAISGYAQTMLSAKISEEEQREALVYIVDECKRLERLSKKMMNLLELNQSQELEFTDVPVIELFEMAQKSCKTILESKKISLIYTQQGEHFYMDIDLMTDVMINLIDNAVKASEPGKEIILRAYDRCIEVQDFGKGIPKEEQEKILEPFYMIDKSRSRKNGGAGLGLALIAVIAKKHNIKISIHSELGEGSRFILEFL